jgi:hypothetical protein
LVENVMENQLTEKKGWNKIKKHRLVPVNIIKGVCEMKNKRFFVFPAMAALAIGIVAAGCASNSSSNTNEPSPGNNEPKSIKITGITFADTNGEAGVQIFDAPEFGGNSVAREEYGTVHIDNGELLADLKVSDGGDSTDTPWTGSGKYYICLLFAGTDGWADDGGDTHFFWWAKDGEAAQYDIRDTVTTLEFSQFIQR